MQFHDSTWGGGRCRLTPTVFPVNRQGENAIRFRIEWLSVVTLALGLFAAPFAAVAQPPIRIGASLSQTGPNAAPGQNQVRGYQLCVKHLNDKGGVLGWKLELVVYDDGSDPATAVRRYEKLITQDKVDLVLAPFSTPITEPWPT